MSLPLAGVKVLDFTHLLPGEFCSTLLGDLGCEILRLESIKPGLGGKLPPIVDGESLYYWSVHRNKKRVGIDLKHIEGRAIAQRLIENSDVVLENFRPGVMKRLGIDYPAAKQLNASIIYCSISGYGQDSSWSNRPGHDLNFIAESGVLDATQTNFSHRPTLPGALISDYMSASYAALAVASALVAKTADGVGRQIDISMFESALSTQQIMATGLSYLGIPKDQAQFRYPSELANYAVYECNDKRHIAIAPLEPVFWKRFCETAGIGDLSAIEVKPGEDSEIESRLASLFKQKTLAEWITIFASADCCISPVNTVDEALKTLPVQERNAVTYLLHPTLGPIPQLASPMLSPADRARAQVPVLDSDKAVLDVLKDLGYSATEIERLCDEQIIALRHAQQ